MQKTTKIIDKIKSLVASNGYIYALCMILFEDFHIDPENMHKTDHRSRIGLNEAALLLGFLIQNEIDYTFPSSPKMLLRMKKKTYELLEELHTSYLSSFAEELNIELQNEPKQNNPQARFRDMLFKREFFIEAIFYSGTGVYDFQYLEFMEKKYKYDIPWLLENKSFDIHKTQMIVRKTKSLLQEKSKKVHLFQLKERIPEAILDLQKKDPNEDWQKRAEECLPVMEFHQYVDLFLADLTDQDCSSKERMKKAGWISFYSNLIKLFIVDKSDFEDEDYFSVFFNLFSVSPEIGCNQQFTSIGNYNLINSHPVIKFENDKYFVPIIYLLYSAAYESPYYWMITDKEYRDHSAKHRGKVGEEIAYDFLKNIFGPGNTLKSVKLRHKNKQDITDIDVLCILGNKALCVQVKSKKLTELARTGDDVALKIDFQYAVQDAYLQGLSVRQILLNETYELIAVDNSSLILPKELNDVFIMVLITENYPSLAHQIGVLLNKENESPWPLALTIFDLELLVHYLPNPYQFLYYLRQRITGLEYFTADEEMAFLGYHLDQKLCRIPGYDHIGIDQDFAQMIDRNYYPFKAGLTVSDTGDAIKKLWHNEDFDCIIKELSSIHNPIMTDIIFNLYDLSGKAKSSPKCCVKVMPFWRKPIKV